MVRKIYRKLTKDQIKRSVIFSSCLSTQTKELPNDKIHEVKGTDKDRVIKIDRLLRDKFFNKSHYRYNIIRRLYP